MIAKIAPLTSLPKHLHVFDYLVPLEHQSIICIGQLVRIPLRNKDCFGIVISLENTETPAENTKSLLSLVHPTPFFSKKQLKCLYTFATWYGLSLGGILLLSIPPLQKRKLQHISLEQLPHDTVQHGTKKPTCVHYTSQEEHARVLEQMISGTTLLLVPEKTLIQEVYDLLPPSLQTQAVCWHSDLSQKEQFALCLDIRNGKTPLIIGTRSAVLLPFFTLDTIIIDYEEREQHKHQDKAPRFHVKDIVSQYGRVYGSSIYYTTYSPSFATYYGAHKEHIEASLPFVFPKPKPGFTIIDTENEYKAGNTHIMSEQLCHELLYGNHRDIFLYTNRKGDAKRLHCSTCDFVATCDQCHLPCIVYIDKRQIRCHYCHTKKPLPSDCPLCHSTITYYGHGTDHIAKVVKSLVGVNEHIYQIDGSSEDITYIDTDSRRIIIGTSRAFSYIRWDQTSLIAILSFDDQVSIPEYTAYEEMWHTLMRINYYRSKESICLLHTKQKQHLICRSIYEPDRLYRSELQSRRAAMYPPYCYIVRYMYAHTYQKNMISVLSSLHDTLVYTLTSITKMSKISMPVDMHPMYIRHRYWGVLFIKLPAHEWQEILPVLHRVIPTSIKIDPNPLSLISP